MIEPFSVEDLHKAVALTRRNHVNPRYVIATRDEQYAMTREWAIMRPQGAFYGGSLGSILGLTVLNSLEALITPGAIAERLPEEARGFFRNFPMEARQ